MLKKRENTANIEYTEYASAESLDTIAYNFFNDTEKWHMIARFNNIFYFFDKENKTILKIPNEVIK